MKFLVFGDVHGNLVALEQLFRIEKNNYDIFICHGDIVNYGPWSDECIQFLIEKKNGFLLLGNHEEYYIKGFYPGDNIVAKSFFEFCYPRFDKSMITDLKNFEVKINIEDYSIQHSINGLYIFKDTDINQLEFESNTIIGHSHQQFHRSINEKELYNTGSIGQNRTLLNVSNYLIVDTETKQVELKYFKHDIYKVISEMEKLNYPDICLSYYKSKKILK